MAGGMTEHFHNARIVLADEIILGSVAVADGRIAAIDPGSSAERAGHDLEGDYLLPGLVDIHSDNLEKFIAPRPNVVWPSVSAAVAHDANVIGVGITTILDAVALVGGKDGNRAELYRAMIDGLDEARARGALRADHLLHIRCEVPDQKIIERFETIRGHSAIRMISLMDHTPGQRVFADLDMWRDYRKKGRAMTDQALDEELLRERDAHEKYAARNRAALAALAGGDGLVVATHDDATPANILEGAGLGSTIAEFPTTIEAARCARESGLAIVMGGPNLVRGGSHVGNVSTSQCAGEGLLDIMSSDYMPVSLLHAAFILTRDPVRYDLPRAVATVSRNPAQALGLPDRGEIAIGRVADLVRVRDLDGLPVVQSVWRAGTRVH
jgi:alpha-D-ribose 1-methylphosphonate 5-triphosphate diphosphatase